MNRLTVTSFAAAALVTSGLLSPYHAGAVGPVPSTPADQAQSGGASADATSTATSMPAGPSLELRPGIVLSITELRRMPDKGVMQLKFAVMNSTDTDTSLKDLGLAYNHQLRDIHVIDFAGRKQYDIGNAGGCLCSTFSDASGGVVRSGETREFWAWYALPQGSAKKMAIRIPDHQPIMDVPVQ